jgi:hypothetical protein
VAAGWRGEGCYRREDGVLFVKTHDPMFPRFARADFAPTRAVYLVRNPLDAVRSYFHLEVGGRHDVSLNATAYDDGCVQRGGVVLGLTL